MQSNSKVNKRVFVTELDIWVDPNGRITQAAVVKTDGDEEAGTLVAKAIENKAGFGRPPFPCAGPSASSCAGNETYDHGTQRQSAKEYSHGPLHRYSRHVATAPLHAGLQHALRVLECRLGAGCAAGICRRSGPSENTPLKTPLRKRHGQPDPAAGSTRDHQAGAGRGADASGAGGG
ncbi:hypothetical protein [Hankyongella ginsenosidimutans]|uniref:hypothetical protein n=1 Tax=Hankyongella ginsenosidimutans TaxID=1763828 RepID=UPI001CA318CF